MYILHEVVGALIYLHGESRMHRDVKAANILLSCNGDVKMSGACPLHGCPVKHPQPLQAKSQTSSPAS